MCPNYSDNPVEMPAMANGNPLRTIPLGNGLMLEIYDQSRKVAGDRWLVKLVVKINIPIERLSGDTIFF